MTEEERLLFSEDVKKVKRGYLYIIIAFGIILTCLLHCNNNKYNQLKGKYEVLENDYYEQKESVIDFEKTRKREKDSLNGEIKRREMENKRVVSDNKKIISQINNIKKSEIKVPNDVVGLVKYFNERYKTKDNKVIEDKVGLTEFTAYDVSYELEEGDRLEEILPLKDKLIENKDLQISNLEKDKVDINTKLTSAELNVQKQKELNVSADKNIDNLKQQVSKLQTKSTLTKILIPASFIVGGYLGFQIAK